jgi:hypothetical protein
MTATMHIWIRAALAVATLVLFVAGPTLVRGVTIDDAEDRTPHVEQSSPEERSNHPRPARSVRREPDHPVSLSTDLDTLVPPPRSTDDDAEEDGPDHRNDASDDLVPADRDGREGPPGTDRAAETEGSGADRDRDGGDESDADRDRNGGDGRTRPVGDELHLADLDLEDSSTRVRSAQVWYQQRGLDTGGPTRLGRGEATSRWDTDWPPAWPDEFTIGPSCELTCIKKGTAHGGSTTIYLNVWTTTPVLWHYRITNDELGYERNRYEHQLWTTQPHMTVDDLAPGTTYHVTIAVRDAWGNEEEASGSFTTTN